MKRSDYLLLVLLVAGTVGGFILYRHRQAQSIARKAESIAPPVKSNGGAGAPLVVPKERDPTSPRWRPRLRLPATRPSADSTSGRRQPVVPLDPDNAQRLAQPDQVEPEPEPVDFEAIGRAALPFVGIDPDADEAWYESINDPDLSPEARQNLIEDLNEDGFPDPKNITMDDLPLIQSRLALIEQVAPDAMDEVNAAAFEEAYKDLLNMLDSLSEE